MDENNIFLGKFSTSAILYKEVLNIFEKILPTSLHHSNELILIQNSGFQASSKFIPYHLNECSRAKPEAVLAKLLQACIRVNWGKVSFAWKWLIILGFYFSIKFLISLSEDTGNPSCATVSNAWSSSVLPRCMRDVNQSACIPHKLCGRIWTVKSNYEKGC